MNIENVVRVDINISKALVSQKNFGRGMILGYSNRFAEQFRLYGSLDDVVADFEVTDAEYLAAKAYFTPAVAPVDLMIANAAALVKQVNNVSATLAAVVYVLSINGTGYTLDYTGGAPADLTTLMTAFKALIDADTAQTVLATLSVAPGAPDQELVLTAPDFSVSFSVGVSANLTSTVTAAYVGVDTNLQTLASTGGGSDWYGLILTSRTKADILKAASWVETASGRYVFIGVSDDADVLTSATDDVASVLKGLAYTRTAYFWNQTSELVKYPEAVWFGLMLPKDPGSATYALKTLEGILPSELSFNEVSNLIAKRASYYVTIGGVDVTQNSMTADGDYIDITIGLDWLRATMEQDVYQLLVSVDKVPFTDEGIQLVGNIIKAVLKKAVDPQTVLASFTTTFPKASDFTPTERASRVLNKLKFGGVLAGAVHKVNIVGNVTF